MSGERYDGGGIATTVATTRAASYGALVSNGQRLLTEMRAQEHHRRDQERIRATVTDEARLTRIAAGLTNESYLAGHVVQPEFAGNRDVNVELVAGPMPTACARHARWADVFSVPGSPRAFDGDESSTILNAASAVGLGLRVHAGQLGPGPRSC